MIWGGQNKSKQITLLSDFFYSLNWISPPNDLRKWTSFSKIVRCCCQVQNVLIGYDDSYWFGKYTLGSKKEDFYFMARLYFLSTIKKESTSTQSSHEIRGKSKKSVSWSKPRREMRFFAWCSACLKYHILSIFRCCKILTIFAVFYGKF